MNLGDQLISVYWNRDLNWKVLQKIKNSVTSLVHETGVLQISKFAGNKRRLYSFFIRYSGFIQLSVNQKNSLELFTVYSQTSFNLIPSSAQLSTAVFSPYFTANLGLDIFFSGQEKDKYKTGLAGLTWNQQINKNLKLKWMTFQLQ